MLDLLATGYPSLDHILPVSYSPAVGETALIGGIVDEAAATFGGCGANVAVGLQRLGFQTGVAMVVGDDAPGLRYREYLLAQGVDCRNLTLLPGQTTSRSYLFRNGDGEYQNFFFPGASDAWTGELCLHGLDAVRWGLITVGTTAYNIQFARRLAEQGIPLAWQLKPDIAAYPREALEYFVRVTQLIFCNQIEADYLCRLLGLSDMREVFERGVAVLVMTLGEHGARLLTHDYVYDIPAVSTHVADTTGAGDAFTAGFLAGYLRQYPLPACGRLAAVMASFALEQTGCQTNLPDWQRLCNRYETHFGRLL